MELKRNKNKDSSVGISENDNRHGLDIIVTGYFEQPCNTVFAREHIVLGAQEVAYL